MGRLTIPGKTLTEAKMAGKEKMAFSQWLRAEVKEYSPYWQMFYEGKLPSDDSDEVIPETPPFMISKVLALSPPIVEEVTALIPQHNCNAFPNRMTAISGGVLILAPMRLTCVHALATLHSRQPLWTALR